MTATTAITLVVILIALTWCVVVILTMNSRRYVMTMMPQPPNPEVGCPNCGWEHWIMTTDGQRICQSCRKVWAEAKPKT